MSRTRKTLVIITGTILLIVLFFIVLATFDWNRLKLTIDQKVSAELNRPFRHPRRSRRGLEAAAGRARLA